MSESQTPEWLKENFSKQDAEDDLKSDDKPINSFLVRFSKILPWLALSIKLENAIKHYKIHKDNEGRFYVFDTKKFEKLQDLISFYSNNNWEDIVNKNETSKPLIRADDSNYDVSGKGEQSKTHKEETKKPPVPVKSLKIKGTEKPISANKSGYVIPMHVRKLSNSSAVFGNEDDYYSSPMSPKLVEKKEMSEVNFTRIEAEKYLATKEKYTHLLRSSEKTGNKCISLKSESGVCHYVIYSYGPQYYIRYHEKFSSVKDLIEYYSKNNWQDLLNPNEDNKNRDTISNSVSDKPSLPKKESQNACSYDYVDHYQAMSGKHYMKTFTRFETEAYLSKLCINSYLIRPGTDGTPTLSLKTENNIAHYKIFNKNCCYYIHEQTVFPTIATLIDAYSKNNFKDLFNPKPEKEPKTTNAKEDTSIVVDNLSQREVEQYLSTKPIYSYVVRSSNKYIGCQTLSVKFPDEILHYVIYSSEKGFYIFKNQKFDSINGLVEDYSRHQWGKLLRLTESSRRGRLGYLSEMVVKYSMRTFDYLTEKYDSLRRSLSSYTK